MQVWMGIDEDLSQARAKVAGSMEAFYRVPFERFEKWTPFGPPAAIAEFLAPYVEAGCGWFNFVIADAPDATLERAIAVRDALRRICGG
jgi:hypothetical protein